jgi:hypothetical protein
MKKPDNWNIALLRVDFINHRTSQDVVKYIKKIKQNAKNRKNNKKKFFLK